jgi:hypothetical protein
VIGKIIDLIEDQNIGKATDPVNNVTAQGPNGQKFTHTFTGNGANYIVDYSLTVSAL